MGKTKDYLDYLNTEIGISPASSQEELDCAQSLADVFSSHGLDPQIQEFSAPSLGLLPYGVAMVLLFVGILLAGMGGVALVIGVLLVIAAGAVLVMRRSGNDVLSKFGPRCHSQNVVALRKADGDEESRQRPIVIIAHYDTQRTDILSKPGISAIKRYLAQVAPYATAVVFVCTLVQVLLFLPDPVRRTLWIVGLIASLPMLLWGVSLIAARFMPYANGAIDNKSSLAAMFGVLDYVTGGSAPVSSRAPEAAAEPEPAAAVPVPAAQPVRDSIVRPARRKEPEMRKVVEEVHGERHGENVLRELGILPESCEITYIEPEVRMVPVEPVEPEPELPAEPAVATEPVATRGVSEPASGPTTQMRVTEPTGVVPTRPAMPTENLAPTTTTVMPTPKPAPKPARPSAAVDDVPVIPRGPVVPEPTAPAGGAASGAAAAMRGVAHAFRSAAASVAARATGAAASRAAAADEAAAAQVPAAADVPEAESVHVVPRLHDASAAPTSAAHPAAQPTAAQPTVAPAATSTAQPENVQPDAPYPSATTVAPSTRPASPESTRVVARPAATGQPDPSSTQVAAGDTHTSAPVRATAPAVVQAVQDAGAVPTATSEAHEDLTSSAVSASRVAATDNVPDASAEPATPVAPAASVVASGEEPAAPASAVPAEAIDAPASTVPAAETAASDQSAGEDAVSAAEADDALATAQPDATEATGQAPVCSGSAPQGAEDGSLPQAVDEAEQDDVDGAQPEDSYEYEEYAEYDESYDYDEHGEEPNEADLAEYEAEYADDEYPVDGTEAMAPLDAEASQPADEISSMIPLRERVRRETDKAGDSLSSLLRGPRAALSRVISSVEERLSKLEDGQRTDVGPVGEKDHRGISTMTDESATEASDAERDDRPEPEAIEDPNWGKSTFQPDRQEVSSVARRASLFDLPDPFALSQDSLTPVDDDDDSSIESEPTANLPRTPSATAPIPAATAVPASAQAPRPAAPVRSSRHLNIPDLDTPASTDFSSQPTRPTAPVRTHSASVARRTPDISAIPDVPAPVRIDSGDDAAAPAPARQAAPATQRPAATSRSTTARRTPAPVHAAAPTSRTSRQTNEEIQVLSANTMQSEEGQRHKKHHLSGLFGHKHKQSQESMSEWLGVDEDYNAKEGGEEIGSWDNFNDDEGSNRHWKGGAARSAELRDAADQGQAIAETDDGAAPEDLTDTELRDAILSMGDDALRCHDIWFVVTGASSLGHAGIQHFVNEHRRDLRGSFIVNLECIGAGGLTMLTREGFGVVRRADRRCGGLLSAVANDLHIPLGKEDRVWADTEATPLMRKSLRAVTIMGLDDADLPAFAHTDGDIPENVDEAQVENVATLLAEMIRRA